MRKFTLLIFFSILAIFPIDYAKAACTGKLCVDVYTQNGQLVIEGKKAGSTSSPTPRATTSTPKPTPKPRPKPTTTRKYSYRPRTTAPRPKSSTKSLADKILESLPTMQVAYQPEGKALIKVPVIFFTDMPTSFTKEYSILGSAIQVYLSPSSLWSFGDGSMLITSKPGHPYPSTDITHSYSVPGTYTVTVATLWTGRFKVGGISFPITGAIKQISAVDVKVVGASTKFVGK
jgi:hypothetical protein